MDIYDILERINYTIDNAWNCDDKKELPLLSVIGGEVLYRSILYASCAYYFYDKGNVKNGDLIKDCLYKLEELSSLLKFDFCSLGNLHSIYTAAMYGDDPNSTKIEINNFINRDDDFAYYDCYGFVILPRMCDGLYDLLNYIDSNN